MKQNKVIPGYSVALNSDRVHVSRDGVPVDTMLWNNEDGKKRAIGRAIEMAIALAGGPILVRDLSPTITIKTTRSKAVDEWERKEEGSWEDHDKDPNHPHAILRKFGGMVTMTENQAKDLWMSGDYQSTSWQPEEIRGGKQTMQTIARYTKMIEVELRKLK